MHIFYNFCHYFNFRISLGSGFGIFNSFGFRFFRFGKILWVARTRFLLLFPSWRKYRMLHVLHTSHRTLSIHTPGCHNKRKARRRRCQQRRKSGSLVIVCMLAFYLFVEQHTSINYRQAQWDIVRQCSTWLSPKNKSHKNWFTKMGQ